MIFNFLEETKEIETISRYNGGWLKTVNGLDKSVSNGYSIEGNFVKAGDFKENYQPGLYIDCSKDGSRKNQIWNYHLFRLDEDGFHLLQTVEDGGRNWAVDFWEKIEEELNNNKSEVTATDIINSLYEKYDEKLINEVAELLNKKQDKKYEINGKPASQHEIEAYLKLSSITCDKEEAGKIKESFDEISSYDECNDDDVASMLAILKEKKLIKGKNIKNIKVKENYETKDSFHRNYQYIVSDELKMPVKRAYGVLNEYISEFKLGNYIILKNKIILYNINYEDNSLLLYYIE